MHANEPGASSHSVVSTMANGMVRALQPGGRVGASELTRSQGNEEMRRLPAWIACMAVAYLRLNRVAFLHH